MKAQCGLRVRSLARREFDNNCVPHTSKFSTRGWLTLSVIQFVDIVIQNNT